MDISNVTDLTALKALAYDQIAIKEQAELNLNTINQRIDQVVGGDTTVLDLPKDGSDTDSELDASESGPTDDAPASV